MNAIRTYRNAAAHNLKFTDLSIPSKYKPPAFMISKLLGTPLFHKNSVADKKSLTGLYGVILSMLIFLNTPYLRAKFVSDILFICENDKANEQSLSQYAEVTNMPHDVLDRFHKYYRMIWTENHI